VGKECARVRFDRRFYAALGVLGSQIEQKRGNAGIREMGGNTRAHGSGSENGYTTNSAHEISRSRWYQELAVTSR
jgi:hypothetical protein